MKLKKNTGILSLPGVRLLTLINLNKDKQSHFQQSVGWDYLSIPKHQRLHHWSLGKDKKFHSTLNDRCDYISKPVLKLSHVNKRGHWRLRAYEQLHVFHTYFRFVYENIYVIGNIIKNGSR